MVVYEACRFLGLSSYGLVDCDGVGYLTAACQQGSNGLANLKPPLCHVSCLASRIRQGLYLMGWIAPLRHLLSGSNKPQGMFACKIIWELDGTVAVTSHIKVCLCWSCHTPNHPPSTQDTTIALWFGQKDSDCNCPLRRYERMPGGEADHAHYVFVALQPIFNRMHSSRVACIPARDGWAQVTRCPVQT